MKSMRIFDNISICHVDLKVLLNYQKALAFDYNLNPYTQYFSLFS